MQAVILCGVNKSYYISGLVPSIVKDVAYSIFFINILWKPFSKRLRYPTTPHFYSLHKYALLNLYYYMSI